MGHDVSSPRGERHILQGELGSHQFVDLFFTMEQAIKAYKEQTEGQERAREEAEERLSNPEFPAPIGAFVLRNSSSRPGCYALTIKEGFGDENDEDDDGIMHYLIVEGASGE